MVFTEDIVYIMVVFSASFVCNMVIDGIGYSFGVMLPTLMTYFDAGAVRMIDAI